MTRIRRRDFVAWDGEGIGSGRRHQYVLLGCSQAELFLRDTAGLSTRNVLDTLVRGFTAYPDAVHVGFAISYDVNMLLRDLPRETLRELWERETVEWQPKRCRTVYKLSWRPRKYFRVMASETADTVWHGGTWWDVWPFFQSSFVKALEKYGVTDDAMREKIQRMKERRGTFRVRDFPAMIDYNNDEVEWLVKLMETLQDSLDRAKLTVKRWDGPGAIAASLLTREDYKRSISAPVPEEAKDAFQFAYYGGRIECARYGHLAPKNQRTLLHHYDINSAYPAAMRSLPCRASGCGEWIYEKSARTFAHAFAVYRVRWSFHHARFHPFPWRSARGSVFFPPHGEGWAWRPEVEAAMRFARGQFCIMASWRWVSRCTHRKMPCVWMDEVYAERSKAKASGDGAEHALKLGMNSTYGKVAQRVGARWDYGKAAWQLPPFHDLAGAGWITSTVRAQLYRAAMQAPDAIVMLATDAIYSTVPLDLDVSPSHVKALGAWDYQRHRGGTFVQSGVYFLDDPDGTERLYSRGFDSESVERRAIVRGWRARRAHVHAFQERFVGLGRALASEKSFRSWRAWQREPRDIALTPWGTKREPQLTRGARVPPDASRGLVSTWPTDTRKFWEDVIGGRGAMTCPSAVPWRDLEGADVGEIDAVGLDEIESEDALL